MATESGQQQRFKGAVHFLAQNSNIETYSTLSAPEFLDAGSRVFRRIASWGAILAMCSIVSACAGFNAGVNRMTELYPQTSPITEIGCFNEVVDKCGHALKRSKI